MGAEGNDDGRGGSGERGGRPPGRGRGGRPGTPGAPVEPRILSCGIVPIYFTPGGLQYLLLRAYKYWDFPKGVVRRGEEPLQGALRELEEETTLTEPKFRWGTEYRETGPYARGKVARYYVAEVDRVDVSLPINPFLGIPEHHEFRWVTYDQARQLLSERVRPILEWAHAKVTVKEPPR